MRAPCLALWRNSLTCQTTPPSVKLCPRLETIRTNGRKARNRMTSTTKDQSSHWRILKPPAGPGKALSLAGLPAAALNSIRTLWCPLWPRAGCPPGRACWTWMTTVSRLSAAWAAPAPERCIVAPLGRTTGAAAPACPSHAAVASVNSTYTSMMKMMIKAWLLVKSDRRCTVPALSAGAFLTQLSNVLQTALFQIHLTSRQSPTATIWTLI